MDRSCEICGEKTDLRGWVFVTPPSKEWTYTSGKKEYHWWCRSHFLVWMFNLYPYKCTTACGVRHQKCSGIVLSDEERYTWVQLEAGMAVHGKKRTPRPRCPRCSKPMKPVGLSLAVPRTWRKQKSSK